MKLLINLCAHDGIVSHFAGVGTIVKRYIDTFSYILNDEKIEYTINLISPEYNEDGFGYSLETKEKNLAIKNTNIIFVANGNDGENGYGTHENWQILSSNTAQLINNMDFSGYDKIITIANDTPFAGVLEILKKTPKHYKVWIPHSTGKIHKVDSALVNSENLLVNRIEWEMAAIRFINCDLNSYLGSTGKYICNHLVEEYYLNENKVVSIINGEILSHKTQYDETEEMENLFLKIKDYEGIILAFGRAEEYKNLEATMYLGGKLGLKPIVITKAYYNGQPLIKEYEKIAIETDSEFFVDVPFFFPQYILKHYNKKMVLLIPSKKEIVGLIINEARKINKDNVLIVANDIGGMHEQIEDGFDGVLVDLVDLDNSALKIKFYMEEDIIKNMNANSQNTLNDKYDFEKNCREFLNFILGGI